MAFSSFLLYGIPILCATPVFMQEKFNIAESVNKFSVDLLAATDQKASDNINIALSPFTIWTLLSIISEGAVGATADQIEKALRLPENKNVVRDSYQRLSQKLQQKSDGAEFDTSSAIFVKEKFQLREKFKSVAKQFYNTTTQQVNFDNADVASNIINKYIAAATNNRITELVYPKDLQNAHLFLTTTMYFKGQWQVPFNKTATKSSSFYDEKKNKIGNVQMMYQSYPYPYGRIDGLKIFALEIPYGYDDLFSMLILLPRSTQTLRGLLNSLKEESITDILAFLQKSRQMFDDNVHVYIPKMKISSDFNLDPALHDMGIRDLFDSQQADLLGMFDQYLYVSRIIQKAEIELDEEGTVASAAGGSVFLNRSPPPRFLANRPFLYFIIHKVSGTVVFSGRVSNPNALG
ncbi:serine protease inhibitor 77Ba [Sitophilus oryzae]|uniref:Serine protease inhibitor 77Ba n=1 Tax=Sitophilus oryzae TaxID=7048 RepID=A0A6J2YHG4_SITOR|nr:serine protease inhibitor 77Ba [Sitophilus oryzae]